MPKRRDIRRCAMQLMYQLDVRGETNPAELPMEVGDPQVKEEATALASDAWAVHEQADVLFTELAPKWPAHRQPPVDRAILRLAYHEIASARVPIRIAINEAVELAKVFCADPSASFINGLLDKAARNLKGQIPEKPAADPNAKPATDPWLADALESE